MKLRVYREGDLEHISRRPQDDFGDMALEGVRYLCENGNSYVFEHDGIPVALFGTTILWEGVAQVWTIISDHVRGKGLQLTKTIKEMLDGYCKAHHVKRCETVVKSNVEENVKWMKLFGFEYECTHKQASPEGGDLDIYVKFYSG